MRKLLRHITLAILVTGAFLPLAAEAARTSVDWVNQSGTTYIQPNFGFNGVDLLINGANHYINFNTVTGASGYGIRDNAGTIECKNSGGSWAACAGGGGGSGTVTSVDVSGGSTGFTTSGGPVTTAGTITLAGLLNPASGGTGTTSPPTFGQILVGNAGGTYTLTATSSLGLVEYSDAKVNAYVHASTTIPKTYTANTFAPTQTFTLAPIFSSLTGLLKGNGASAVTVAANGTDYTLNTARTCSAGDFISAVTAAGVFTCTTPSTGTTYTGTYPIVVTGSVISTPLSTTTLRQTYGTAQGGDLSIATSSDTNLLLNVTNSSGAFTLTPAWTGTLADGRITSASTWNAKVGTITVASSNGFAGSSSGGTTPALTLTTTVTGVVKGNGTALSAASNGTDYSLITAKTCTVGDFVSAVTAAGVFTCTTPSSTGITALGSGFASTSATAITFSTSTLSFNGLTVGQTIVPSAGALLFTPTITGTLSNSGLANSTISGVALGGTLNGLSHDSTLTGTTYNGSATVSNWGFDLTHPNSWTGLQQFTNASSSLFSVTNKAYFGGSGTSTFSSTGNLTLVNAANALTIPALGTAAGTFLAADASGNVIATTTPAGSGAVSSVSNADGTLTISPTTGAVVSSLALGHANTWTGQQTFNTSAPIFGTLSGLLQGNGASAVTAVAGTAGQFPYYNGTNTLLATSTLFVTPASAVGIGTAAPAAKFDILGTSTASTGQIADFWKSDGTTVMRVRNDGNVGIGTTTPWGALAISTPAQQSGLLPLFNVASTTNASLLTVLGNGNVGFGTSTPDKMFTVEGSFPAANGYFAVFRNTGSANGAALRLDAAGGGNANLSFSVANVLKGSMSWDNTRNFIGFLNGVYSTNDFSLRVNSDGSFTYNDGVTSNELFRINANGRVGIGTTTPWGKLSVSSPSMVAADYANPLFTVATSSDNFGQLFNIFATSSTLSIISTAANALAVDIGVRIGVGISTYLGGSLLDQFTVNGRINTQGWDYIACDAPGLSATGNLNNICNSWAYAENEPVGGVSLLIPAVPLNAGYNFYRISGLQTTNNVAAIFASPVSGGVGWMAAPTSTPVMEATVRFGSSATNLMSTSTVIIGFGSFSAISPVVSTPPVDGCYFTASSTQGNWRAIARNTNSETNVDTGVASTTNTTIGLAGFRRFRIEASNGLCSFYIQNNQTSSLIKVASITTNTPTVGLNTGVIAGNPGAGNAPVSSAPVADIMRLHLWWRDFLPLQ